jgi:positive regulator of sigma E activity
VLKAALLTYMVSFGEIHVFLQLCRIAYLEQTEPVSTLKIVIFGKYSFQKLTQFSHGNNMLEALPFNTDGFLSSDTCVSST